MINASDAYKDAVTGTVRKVGLKAVIDISDPDIVFDSQTGSEQAAFSKEEQLHNKKFLKDKSYATFESNRWILNGDFSILPNGLDTITEEVGSVLEELSGDYGIFNEPQITQLNFKNVRILQACSVYFPGKEYDGVAENFKVEVLQGETPYYTKEFVGNKEKAVNLFDFTVNSPDAIRVTVTKWTIPGRRARIVEIVPGLYERWNENDLASFEIVQQTSFSGISLPYGTCYLSVDNENRRFEPRNKSSIFKSLEERQGIETFISVRLPDGTYEEKPTGRYYQHSGGWKTSSNGLTIEWSLVDIIGLLSERKYIAPSTLPTNLEGWISSIVSQLGINFENQYTIDEEYKEIPLFVYRDSDVKDKTCGELLRYACMATSTFPRADSETGKLAVEPYWNQGNELTLDNIITYPKIKANDDIAAIVFNIYSETGSDTQYLVSGTSTSSNKTESVDNPFIHDEQAAINAAKHILTTYGGNKIEITGRGDPSSELGDVDTIQLDASTAITGRRMYQTFSISDGVLQSCKSEFLQSDGVFLFKNREIITESGTWKAPENVSEILVYVIGGGDAGGSGTSGTMHNRGLDGEIGEGGNVWAGTISINPQQTFDVYIGKGGEANKNSTKCTPGENTTFGIYTSADGYKFHPSYTDIFSGEAFARSGVKTTKNGTGDGGKAGNGGSKGFYVFDGNIITDIVSPGAGTVGTPGASGCVVIYYNKE